MSSARSDIARLTIHLQYNLQNLAYQHTEYNRKLKHKYIYPTQWGFRLMDCIVYRFVTTIKSTIEQFTFSDDCLIQHNNITDNYTTITYTRLLEREIHNAVFQLQEDEHIVSSFKDIIVSASKKVRLVRKRGNKAPAGSCATSSVLNEGGVLGMVRTSFREIIKHV